MGEPRWFANHNLRKNEDEMKRSKKYNEAAAKVIKDHLYTPLEAVTLAKETSTVKYNASVEVALVLGVDPKKADQAIRSTVNLPHGTGKTAHKAQDIENEIFADPSLSVMQSRKSKK